MLIDWFPDRKGLASGLVIAGFGSGALFFTPVMGALSSKFAVMPTFLGSSLEVVLEGGRQFSQVGGRLQEVVYATTSELAKLPYEGLAEGFYLVGSGNTGVAPALACIGAMYTATIVSSALMIKRPAPGYVPAGLLSQNRHRPKYNSGFPRVNALSQTHQIPSETEHTMGQTVYMHCTDSQTYGCGRSAGE